MRLSEFLRLPEYEQKKMLSDIVKRGESTPESEWHDANELPASPGYYPVLAQYGKWKHTRKIGVARWSGDHWGDCYDNYKTTGGRWSVWNVLKWTG